ncbi:MAG: hypothetical protein LBU72_01405 [Burkholderiaceae bacterium]|jgi:hypothetical protein|nr:hypothetical protein [Burkholderiaceae bacterium]
MVVRTLFCLIATLALAGALTIASAQTTSFSANTASTSAGKTSKKQKSHTVKYIRNPNHETPAERERRLKRECRGMPNAGACLGYAS